MAQPKFSIGDVILHLKFEYRGVVIEAHDAFRGDDEWYESVAKSRPPKDRPWYAVLVHGADQQTYVAERHLEADASGRPVEHPLLHFFFREFSDGRYRVGGMVN